MAEGDAGRLPRCSLAAGLAGPECYLLGKDHIQRFLSGFCKALFGSLVNDRHSPSQPSVRESVENRALLWLGSPDPDRITSAVERTSQGPCAKDGIP